MFCVECGLCALDITRDGTVIAPAPTAPVQTRGTVRSVDSLLAELEDTYDEPEDVEIPIELVEDDIAEEDWDELETEKTRRFLKGTPWTSLAPGVRRVGQPAHPPRRVTAAYGVVCG
jgi:hypothetical protein